MKTSTANSDSIPNERPVRSGRRRRGASLIEFTLLGIPAIFLFTSVMTCSVDMWQFFTLSYAVNQTARYAALHGATCSIDSNSCTITRAQVASYFEAAAIALSPASTTVTLNDGSGVITCNPVSSCPSSSSQFPSIGNNTVGTSLITVTASYAMTNPIAMYWPGGGQVGAATFTLGATSVQQVLF